VETAWAAVEIDGQSLRHWRACVARTPVTSGQKEVVRST
jgi:hypothetical protein